VVSVVDVAAVTVVVVTVVDEEEGAAVDVADAVLPVAVEDLGGVVEELAEPAEAPESSLKNIVMKVSS